jgi:hypothetical protein
MSTLVRPHESDSALVQTSIAVSIPQNRRTDDLVELFHISDALKWRSTLLCLLKSSSERVGCFNVDETRLCQPGPGWLAGRST